MNLYSGLYSCDTKKFKIQIKVIKLKHIKIICFIMIAINCKQVHVLYSFYIILEFVQMIKSSNVTGIIINV